MPRQFLVFGDKTFKITVPDDAKVTFAPFSPPRSGNDGFRDSRYAVGTLRIYKTEKNILACFSGVTSFRDLSLGYAEEVAVEEGARIWKSDENGYEREDRVSSKRHWIVPEAPPSIPEKF